MSDDGKHDQIADPQTQLALAHQTIAALHEQATADRAKIEHLEIALVAARRIGAATGILMATHKVDQDEAFARLRAASQHLNRTVRDIAEDVLYTGVLDNW